MKSEPSIRKSFEQCQKIIHEIILILKGESVAFVFEKLHIEFFLLLFDEKDFSFIYKVALLIFKKSREIKTFKVGRPSPIGRSRPKWMTKDKVGDENI
jgi:hypothetical protein